MAIKLPSPELRKSLEQATATYQTGLVNSPEALSYLDGRGLSPAEAETFRLGYVDQPAEGHEAFTGMVSIPYLRPSGVVALKFRRIDDGKPKYLNVAGCGTHLYNTEALRYPGRLVGVCEGEFDAIVLDGLCGIPTVGVPGVTQWRAHKEWVALFEGKNVLIFADVDRKVEGKNPGEELAKEIADSLDSARIIRLPEPDESDGFKMDVNRCFIRYGREEICRRAGQSVG